MQKLPNETLCFVDADVLLNLEFGEWLEINPDPNGFYVYPTKETPDLAGFLIVTRKHFFQVDGYDEAIRGWGGEDKDLYERLARTGLSPAFVPEESISPISHGDELRQLGKDVGGFGSKGEAVFMIQLYRAIKRDCWQLTGKEIELEKRKALREHITLKREEAIAAHQNFFEISISVPMQLRHNTVLNAVRGLGYRSPISPGVRKRGHVVSGQSM